MITYLKKCLRRGLEAILSDENSDSVSREPYLDVLIDGTSGPLLRKYLIIGVIGTRLRGIPVDGQERGERLLSLQEAVNQKHFRAIRETFQGKVDYVWEDTGERADI